MSAWGLHCIGLRGQTPVRTEKWRTPKVAGESFLMKRSLQAFRALYVKERPHVLAACHFDRGRSNENCVLFHSLKEKSHTTKNDSFIGMRFLSRGFTVLRKRLRELIRNDRPNGWSVILITS